MAASNRARVAEFNIWPRCQLVRNVKGYEFAVVSCSGSPLAYYTTHERAEQSLPLFPGAHIEKQRKAND